MVHNRSMTSMLKSLKVLLIVICLILPCYFVFQDNFAGAKHNLTQNSATFSNRDDQGEIYMAFKAAMAGEVPDSVRSGYMATGYLSLIGFYHKLSGVWYTPSVDASFAYHGMAYAMAAALLSVLLMFRVGMVLNPVKNKLSLAFFSVLLWIIMYQLSTILRFNYIPWSHYAAAFCGVAFVFSFIEAMCNNRLLWYFAAAFSGILFANVRRHEAMAVFLACAVATAIMFGHYLFLKKNKIDFALLLKRITASISGAIFAVAFIYYFSNGMPMNGHYSQLRSQDTYIREYMSLNPKMIPLHLIQTFVDPNYYSYGNEYSFRRIILGGFSRSDFYMPLLMQLPILFYIIPLTLFASFTGIFLKRDWRTDSPMVGFAFLIGVGSFLTITLGYNATAVWGGTHNKYGLTREFILATLLLTIATGPGLLQFVAQAFKKKRLAWLIPLVGISTLAIGVGQWLIPKYNWFELTSRHLNPKPTTNAKCINGQCEVKISFTDVRNQPLKRPFDDNIIKYDCGTRKYESGAFNLKGDAITFNVAACDKPVDYEIYALFTGYCGTGLPNLKFSACPNKAIAPTCEQPTRKAERSDTP